MLNWGRLLLDGIPFADLLEAQRRDASITWFDFWMAKADRYDALGEQALAERHERSAGEWLWLASLCCQYAQFLWFDEKRWEGQRRKAELYRLAAPYLSPPAERVDLPFEQVEIPGYLRLPQAASAGPVGCAVLLGGLESTKEESLRFEDMLLARGVATFTFDGPGQGELLEQLPLSDDFHRYATAVVDHLVTRSQLDPRRIGVLGRSLGGHYALQCACTDERFAACVSWGGFVDMHAWDAETPGTKEAWRLAAQVATEADARDVVQRSLDLRPLLGRLRCPTYVLHGALDETPLQQTELLRALAPDAPLTVVVEPAGDHCCHNLGPAPRVAMADWLADRLR
jgi:2,6-dihydroxypseudooxynicotine hydrolase